MAQVNPLTREVLIKLVYYGPGLGGKTTTLQKVHAASPPETRGKIVSLATPVDRTLYFDFMPLRVEPVHGYPVRLQLFTVPGQVYFNATRKLVLTGADGVVFVADSQEDRQDANLESLQNLEANLQEQGRGLSTVPHVMQYNKRDLPGICSIEELNATLNLHGVSAFESAAAFGEGVVKPLDELVRLVLLDLEKRSVFGGEERGAPAHDFAPAREGIKESLAKASEVWQDPAEVVEGLGGAPALAPRALSRPAPAFGDAIRAGRSSSDPPRVARLRSARPGAQAPGPSWAALFPDDQKQEVVELEQDLVHGDFRSALRRMDALGAELLADASEEAALSPEERKPLVVALALGMGGERWLGFRRLVQRARLGAEVDERAALGAYALLIELSRLCCSQGQAGDGHPARDR